MRQPQLSLRARLVRSVLRTTVKPLLARMHNPLLARKGFALTAGLLFRDPAFAHSLPWPIAGSPGLRISGTGAGGQGAILYLHGGGYVAGSPATHRAMLARLSQMTGLEVFAPDYPLAPEHPAPAQSVAALAAWTALVALGHRPRNIVLGGDSAGGGLALALLSQLCRDGRPPAGLFALSPWTDLTLSGPSMLGNARADPILPARRAPEAVALVRGGLPPDDPRLSPLFAEFPGCPPVLLQLADTEILLDDSIRMAEKLRGAGTQVTLDLWPGLPHVWPLLAGWLPEADQALQRIASFVRTLTPPLP